MTAERGFGFGHYYACTYNFRARGYLCACNRLDYVPAERHPYVRPTFRDWWRRIVVQP